MTLTEQNLTQIRGVILEALDVVVIPRFESIENTLGEHSKLLNQHSDTLTNHGVRLAGIEEKLDVVDGRSIAIENDVKELYFLYDNLEKHTMITHTRFAKLSSERKLRIIQGEILTMARSLRINLSLA